jgi:hypothetical protein
MFALKVPAAGFFCAALVVAMTSIAPAGELNAYDVACGQSTLLTLTDGASGVPSACTLNAGSFLIEGLYFQNASAVGGTALAAYPMFRLRGGVTPRVELLVDTPSQVAQSGLAGAGLYLTSSAGFGANYALVRGGRLALTSGVEVEPPVNRYSPSRQEQSKYALNMSGLYQVTPALGITGFVEGTTSRTSGLSAIFPGASVGAKIATDERTGINVGLGSRILGRYAHAQSFADLSVERQVGKHVSFNTGIGTAFNPVHNQKSHYLAAGVNFLP